MVGIVKRWNSHLSGILLLILLLKVGGEGEVRST